MVDFSLKSMKTSIEKPKKKEVERKPYEPINVSKIYHTPL